VLMWIFLSSIYSSLQRARMQMSAFSAPALRSARQSTCRNYAPTARKRGSLIWRMILKNTSVIGIAATNAS
jgi:hypothetical protein